MTDYSFIFDKYINININIIMFNNLIKISDEITETGVYVYHSTRDAYTSDYINQFLATWGRGGGSMHGSGFYANLEIEQTKKGLYGIWILKCKLRHFDRYFIFEYFWFKQLYPDTDLTEENFIDAQFEKFGFTGGPEMISSLKQALKKDTSSHALKSVKFAFDYRSKFKKKLLGFCYKGDLDGYSIVCWYPFESIVPLALTCRDYDRWLDVHSEEYEQLSEQSDNPKILDRDTVIKSEIITSFKKEADLVTCDAAVDLCYKTLTKYKNDAAAEYICTDFIEQIYEAFKAFGYTASTLKKYKEKYSEYSKYIQYAYELYPYIKDFRTNGVSPELLLGALLGKTFYRGSDHTLQFKLITECKVLHDLAISGKYYNKELYRESIHELQNRLKWIPYRDLNVYKEKGYLDYDYGKDSI